jgi:CSLREA domain-containing protein
MFKVLLISSTLLLLALFLILTEAFDVAKSVPAASIINVNSTHDELNNDGNCSLREAIKAANLDLPVDACPAGSESDTIVIPAGLYSLAIGGRNEDAAGTGDLDISGTVTIVGIGQPTIDGNQLDRVFQILPNSHVTLSGLTIRNGLLGYDDGIGAGLSVLLSFG